MPMNDKRVPMRVLVAEHETSAARLLQSFLQRWGYEVAIVDNLNDLWAAIYGQVEHGLLLLDWSLPGLDGERFCRALRDHLGEAYMYLLLLSEEGQNQEAAKGLLAGADDYISKPYDARELRTRLHTGARIVEMQRELAASRELEQFTMRDPKTGLWNVEAGLEILHRELNRARREGIPVAVIVGSIEGGDPETEPAPLALGPSVKEALERLVDSVRCYDSVGLYTDTHFVMILPGCDEERAQVVADRARRRVRDMTNEDADEDARWALRLGIATWEPGQDINGQSLVRAALVRMERDGSRDPASPPSPDADA